MSSTISNRKQRKVKQHKTNMSQYLPVPLISSISNVAQIQILPLESLGQARHLKLHQDHPLDFEWKNDCQSEATKKCHVDLSKLRNSNTFFFFLFWDPCQHAHGLHPWYARGPARPLVKPTLKNQKTPPLTMSYTKDSTELGHYILNRYIISNLTKDRTEQLNNQILLK